MHTTKETAQELWVSGFICQFVALLLLLECVGVVSPAEMDADTPPPNVVLFIMDDVGMGDIGCFGNHTIKTPNIDGLAREGARLTQHMSLPLCTPSRAALMTGRLPVRYGFAPKKMVSVFLFSSSRGGLPSNETTIAELLKGSGYATALIGKWHLGVSCKDSDSCSDPNSQGFDYFYGLPVTNFRDCGTENSVVTAAYKAYIVNAKIMTSLALVCLVGFLLQWKKLVGIRSFIFVSVVVIAGNSIPVAFFIEISNSCALMENRSIVEQPLVYDHLTQRLHGRAIQFIEKNRNQPFLLVMSFVQAHTALFNNKEFRNHSVHGQYGDNVEEMDWSVGEVLKSLKRLSLEEKTFVYLTSDNGGHVEEFTDAGERQGGWNGVYKGGKSSTWEGGIRVPTIVKFPGHIPAGSVVSQPTHLPDVLPTVARVTGARLPDDRVYDGRDMIPLLTHTGVHAEKEEILHEFMFHYCGGFLNAARYTPKDGDITYKLHYASSHLVPGVHGVMGCFDVFTCACFGPSVDRHDPPLVYDLSNDPSEVNPLDSSDPDVGNVIRKVNEAVATHRGSIPSNTAHQFTVSKTMARPWERPRCGRFPYYTCTDPYLVELKTLKGEIKLPKDSFQKHM